jgi:hypothetical protein
MNRMRAFLQKQSDLGRRQAAFGSNHYSQFSDRLRKVLMETASHFTFEFAFMKKKKRSRPAQS